MHIIITAILSFLITDNSTFNGTRYFINGLEVSFFVNNPISNFFTIFIIFYGLFSLVPLVLIYIILLAINKINKMEVAEQLALASMCIGILAFPILIIFAINLKQKSAPFALMFFFIITICIIVSCKIRIASSQKIYKKAIAGIILDVYYLIVTLSMGSRLL
jgi:hypothetical protein